MASHRKREELDPLLTAPEVRAILNLRSVRTVYSLADQGVLPCIRVGKRMLRFHPQDLLELVRRPGSAGGDDEWAAP